MTLREGFLKAAELVDKGEENFACYAIDEAFSEGRCADEKLDEAGEVFALFRPIRYDGSFWWDRKDHGARILALIFCAEIAESA